MKVPSSVKENLEKLNALCEKHPQFIPLGECAEFLGAKKDGLRASIENGQCPFGIAWQCMGAVNRAFKIPTVTFYLWYTQGKTLEKKG